MGDFFCFCLGRLDFRSVSVLSIDLVALAIAGGAEVIVSRNLRHLKQMALRFPQLRVVSPETFLKDK